MKKLSTLEQLQKYMKVAGLNQSQLSTLLGVSKFTISRWMRGHNNPSPAYKSIIRAFLKNKC